MVEILSKVRNIPQISILQVDFQTNEAYYFHMLFQLIKYFGSGSLSKFYRKVEMTS